MDPENLNLTQEEIDEYKEVFGMFDINGDGA
jgi:Ca2+-binding EF-hand superfamily protein